MWYKLHVPRLKSRISKVYLKSGEYIDFLTHYKILSSKTSAEWRFKFLQLQVFVLDVVYVLGITYCRNNRMESFLIQQKASRVTKQLFVWKTSCYFFTDTIDSTFKSLEIMNADFSPKRHNGPFRILRYKQLFKPSGQPDVISWPPDDDFDWLHWSPPNRKGLILCTCFMLCTYVQMAHREPFVYLAILGFLAIVSRKMAQFWNSNQIPLESVKKSFTCLFMRVGRVSIPRYTIVDHPCELVRLAKLEAISHHSFFHHTGTLSFSAGNLRATLQRLRVAAHRNVKRQQWVARVCDVMKKRVFLEQAQHAQTHAQHYSFNHVRKCTYKPPF